MSKKMVECFLVKVKKCEIPINCMTTQCSRKESQWVLKKAN